MERVETLYNLLTEKFRNRASVTELLNTVKMLESELLHQRSVSPPEGKSPHAPAIVISKQFESPAPFESPEADEPEEKTTEVLQIDEADIEAELEEIKKNADERTKISIQNKPPVHFDDPEEIPTLINRQPANLTAPAKEIHELLPVNNSPSYNDELRAETAEVSDRLQEVPVKDLRKAIGVNDRYKYLNDLFRGDEAMYERSIKTINSFAIFPEAEYWIRRELKLKLAWDDKNETVQQFDQLVRRRFS